MFTVYIIYSQEIDRFYTGFTSLPIEERLAYHKYNNKGFTGKTDDWKTIYTQLFQSKSKALRLERKIKKRGAKRFIEDLNS